MALQHPLLKEGGLLSPLLASLAQWHLVDDPEQGLSLALTEALKAVLRETDGLKRALAQVSHAVTSVRFWLSDDVGLFVVVRKSGVEFLCSANCVFSKRF